MVRGVTWFKCPCCGKIFKALDIEWHATAASQPTHCPNCGTKSPAVGLSGWAENALRKISTCTVEIHRN